MITLKKIKEIDAIIAENEKLKKEVERLQALEGFYKDTLSRCQQMNDEWRKRIYEAKQAKANYMLLSKWLINHMPNDLIEKFEKIREEKEIEVNNSNNAVEGN